MASESFEDRIERACEDLEIPGAILVASDKDGQFRYEKAFGRRSLKDMSKPDPMKIDDTMWLASCTKLITTVAVLQCVDKGQLKLDEDVTTVLPELKGVKILTGFKEPTDEPILVENTKTITLRHLLTHSSGLGYDFFHPTLLRYRKWENKHTPNLKMTKGITEAHLFPLLFAPGEAWEYSAGVDWAGLMAERVNNTTLAELFEKTIWGPLDGGKNFAFHPKGTPVWDKLCDMSERSGGINPIFGIAQDPEGKVEHTENMIWNPETPGCQGGAGDYGSPKEYQLMLASICANDGKILNKETVDEMFKPQLSAEASASLNMKLAIPELNQVYAGMPFGTKVDWGLGGMLNMQDIPGRRRKGSLTWGGYPNLVWFCDRVGGMSGMYGSQINPPGDAKTIHLFGLWETELYKKAGKETL